MIVTMIVLKMYDTVYNSDKFFAERARNWFFEIVKMIPTVGMKVKSKLEEFKSVDSVSELHAHVMRPKNKLAR